MKLKLIDDIYYIKEISSIYSYIRILCGLDCLYKKISILYFLNIILGKINNIFQMNSIINENEIPNNLNISNYPKLNESQENAILKCLKNKFTMIKGPPRKRKNLFMFSFNISFIKIKNYKKTYFIIWTIK